MKNRKFLAIFKGLNENIGLFYLYTYALMSKNEFARLILYSIELPWYYAYSFWVIVMKYGNIGY